MALVTGHHDHPHDDHDDGYVGPATVEIQGTTLPTRVTLAGYFQPLDGRYHWYGRLDADDALNDLVGAGGTAVTVITPAGRATGRLGDPDLWNRFRVEGFSTPPFETADVPGPAGV